MRPMTQPFLPRFSFTSARRQAMFDTRWSKEMSSANGILKPVSGRVEQLRLDASNVSMEKGKLTRARNIRNTIDICNIDCETFYDRPNRYFKQIGLTEAYVCCSDWHLTRLASNKNVLRYLRTGNKASGLDAVTICQYRYPRVLAPIYATVTPYKTLHINNPSSLTYSHWFHMSSEAALPNQWAGKNLKMLQFYGI